MSSDIKALFQTFGKIGFLSFGGPAAQIALMHRVLVDEKNWLTEKQYLNALSFCMLLPGPEAMQIATYSGWRIRGVLGGLIAGLLFVLPGAAIILALAMIYAYFGSVPFVEALFLGVKAAVVIIVIEALLKVSKRALKEVHHWVLAALAFIGIFFVGVPFPIIIIMAGIYGAVAGGSDKAAEAARIDRPFHKTVSTIFVWLMIWLAPLILLWVLAPQSILVDIGLFFSKLAVVTFGGAYAVLAYMAQDVVTGFGWLSAGEMMDSLGLAETTPGPLILVTEFVGFLAAFKAHGLGMAVFAAIVTLWVTFAPCFLWIFAGAPYIEWIAGQPRLSGALSGITAAVVGVILNLSIWFALHVFFDEVIHVVGDWYQLWQPVLTTLNWQTVWIALVSAALFFGLKFGIGKMLTVAALFGLVMEFVI